MSSSTPEKFTNSKDHIVKEVKIFFSIKRCSVSFDCRTRQFNYLNFLLLYYFLSVAKKISNRLQKNTLGRSRKSKGKFWSHESNQRGRQDRTKEKYEEAKQGGPYLIKLNKLFISLYYIIDKFKAKSELSTLDVTTEQLHSRFKIDDNVYSTPDTTPGCDSSQSVALHGSVIALKFEGELMVKIKKATISYGFQRPEFALLHTIEG